MLQSSFQKWDLCVSFICACARSGPSTPKAHLNALQEAGAHPLRGVCWHFTHVLLDAEKQLLQATGLAIDAVLAGYPKPVVQRVEVRTVRSPLLFASLGDHVATRRTNCDKLGSCKMERYRTRRERHCSCSKSSSVAV